MSEQPLVFGSLYSGCAGLDLGLEQAGLTCAFQVEIDPSARAVLAHHWPATRRHDQNCKGGVCVHRGCVNPSHLDAVPHRVNVLRGKTLPAENRAKQACPSGHPYTSAYTSSVSGIRRRVCRPCRNAQQLAYTARKAVQ